MVLQQALRSLLVVRARALANAPAVRAAVHDHSHVWSILTRSWEPALGILRGMARFWGDPDGAICDACDKPITKQQSIMDGIVSTLSAKKAAQFHVSCFQFGDTERRAPKT